MLVPVFLVLQAVVLVMAPFPESHPYSFLNPVIDPWWHKLDQDTQLHLYALWETTEPSLFAFGNPIVNSLKIFSVFTDHIFFQPKL